MSSTSARGSLLAVSGAKYNRRGFGDEPKPLTSSSTRLQDTGALSSSNVSELITSQTATVATAPPTSSGLVSSSESKYWKYPTTAKDGSNNDIVVIHVCDENQQISKDFCCQRDLLVQHMRYFQKFLHEQEHGYDDIDISVHCDVEIFEWLMTYIHEPHNPPKMDKSILISILISSEFLQMEPLVELCVAQVSQCLNEIIKLPIDLSCISEKLVNRIAAITSPKAMSEIKDRKDKILTKLYKRRVELDFSRKGSASSRTPASASSAPRTIAASLTCCRHCGWVYLENYALNLTCRKSPPTIDHRGRLASRHASIPQWSLTAYLKTLHSGGMGWDAIYWHVWAACVVLRVDDVVIHALETDRYVVEPDGVLIRCALPRDTSSSSSIAPGLDSDAESYSGASSRLLVFSLDQDLTYIHSSSSNSSSHRMSTTANSFGDSSVSNNTSASAAASNSSAMVATCKLKLHPASSAVPPTPSGITPSLNPYRPPELLTSEVHDLLSLQQKHITGLSHKPLIQSTMQAMVQAALKAEAGTPSQVALSRGMPEHFMELQTLEDDDNRAYGLPQNNTNNTNNPNTQNVNNSSGNMMNSDMDYGYSERRRGRSPARAVGLQRLFSASQEPRTSSGVQGGGGGGVGGSSTPTGTTSNAKGKQRASTVGPPLSSAQSASASGAPGIAHAPSSDSTNANTDCDTPNDSDAEGPPPDSAGNTSSDARGGGAGGGAGGSAGGGRRVATRHQSHNMKTASSSARSSIRSARTSSANTPHGGGSGSGKNAGGPGGSAGLPPKHLSTKRGGGRGGVAGDSAGMHDDAMSQGSGTSATAAAEAEAEMQRLHEILRSATNSLYSSSSNSGSGGSSSGGSGRTVVQGVWLGPSPLLWHPAAFDEMLNLVEDSTLPEHKKVEWTLDLMREYDEKRMDKLNRWLVQRRNPACDAVFSAGGIVNAAATAAGATGGVKGVRGAVRKVYYKDRAKQPYKCVI